MTIGSCSCEVGKDGSPCKHQYMLWAAKRAKCLNFVPVNSPEDRQKLAKIVIGEALPLSYYTSLRDPTPTELDTTPALDSDTPEPQECNTNVCLDNAVKTTEDQYDDLAEEAVNEACNLIYAKLKWCLDKSLEKGALHFAQRVKKLASSMHGNFGSNELRKGKNGKKIKVRPNRKRKHANGSHQVVGKGRPVSISAMELPPKKAKRDHRFAKSVRQNVNVARKSGSHVMKSKTR